MPAPRVFVHRLLRILGVVAASALGLVILILGVLMMPPVRNAVLTKAVARAKTHLPGEVQVVNASWPSWGAIGFRDVLWTLNGDTLAAADTLTLEMNLKSLVHRDLYARRIVATGVMLDLPAVRAAFPPSAPRSEVAPKKDARFPRRGVLPGLPSVTAESITLRVRRARFNSQWTLVASELEGSCDLSPDTGPRLGLTRLVACTLEQKLELQRSSLHLDGRARTLGGDVVARLDSLGTLVLHVAPSSSDSLALVATLDPGRTASPLRIDLRGRLAWDEERLESFAFRGDIRIPETAELMRWPDPVRKAGTLAPLPPVSLSTEGVLTFRPRFSVRGRVTATPTGWLEGLDLNGAYTEAGIEVESLRAAFPGMRVVGSGSQSCDRVNARIEAAMSDARWLKVILPRFDPPESLAARVEVLVDGPRSAPDVSVDVAGGVRKKSFSVHDAKISGRFPDGLRNSGTVGVSAIARDLRLSTRADLVPRFPIQATVSPIQVEDLTAPARARAPAPAGDGKVRYDGSRRSLRLDKVQLFGDAGTFHIDGELQDGVGDVSLAWESSQTPILLRRLSAFPDSVWLDIERRWPTRDPFHVNARAHVQGKRVTARAEFNLPGPSTLQALLPRQAKVDDLGSLRGHVEGTMDSTWAATVDLSPTSWLNTTPIHIEGARDGMIVDSLRLELEGTTLSLAGSRENGAWDARATAAIKDTRLLKRFVPSLTPRDSCALAVEAGLHGRDVSLQFEGAGRYHAFHLDRMRGTIARTGTRWQCALSASGLDLGSALKLDRLTAGMTTEAEGKESVRLDCAGPTLALTTRALLDRTDGVIANVDTLRLVLSDKELHAVQPFLIQARRHGNGIRFENVDLDGTMGKVTGQGELRPGASLVDVRVALDLEGLAPPSPLVSTWWPERLQLSIVNEGPEAIAAQASVAGLRLRGQSDWVFDLAARGDATGLSGEAHLKGAAGEALSASYFSPGVWQLYPLRIEMNPARLKADVSLHGFPVPWQELGLEAGNIWPASATGHVVVNHDASGPYAREDLEVVLTPPDENERPIRFTTQGAWIVSADQLEMLSQEGDQPLSEVIEARARELKTPGLVASFALSRDTQTQLTGSLIARYLERTEGGFAIDPENGIDVTASAPQFNLATLRAFLPPGYTLSGQLGLEARLSGPPRNPALSGNMEARQILLDMNEGGHLSAQGTLHYSGTLLAPRVVGRIDVQNGVIPVPEQPRKLHAVSGEAFLWQTGAAALGDSTLAQAALPATSTADTTGRFRPVYDLQIVVPSGFWIRGRNLNVELEGDLRLRQQHALPTVVGALEARQGTLNFLGRTFALERGKVQFYGEDKINPGLDIRLNSKVSSTDVYVTLSGTLEEPKLELTSSPSMSEADIMSLLVMGKTADDLNGDQAQLVAQRAAAVAATYGAAELQKKMAGPLGVDMITLNPGGGPEGENSVVVGKYLSPRTLIKYEQALDSAAGFFVTLEYTLTQTITLQTLAGTWQSGAEVSWSKDY